MLDWLAAPDTLEGPLEWPILTMRLLVALCMGMGVAGIYRLSHGREHGSPGTLVTTLILLSVLIAMVSMTIGNSVARAFSLVGALSIVRFRTVVDDTRDTAFVIFAVIVGMAAGVGLPLVPLIGLPIVGVTAVGLSRWRPDAWPSSPNFPCKLKVRLALGRDPEVVLKDLLDLHLLNPGLIDVATARQGAALDLTYTCQLRSQADMTALVNGLNRTEGVMSVELTRTET